MGDFPADNIKWVIAPDLPSTAGNGECSRLPEPKYSVFGERIRHVAPSAMQCTMFCGGKQCKYCNPAKFKKEAGQDAINGLYSAWVTKDILATSRPSTEAIEQYKIIDQFHSEGIRSIINLQHPGEHAACGFGLQDGGFSYLPQHFMDNDVFFYNFGWNDYGVRSLQSILDMVKVFDFALSNGKAAVHCHAGLGRTGVLIACYLIYSTRASSHEAILRVREARPKAIQTRGQINCVNDFEVYVKPMRTIFSENDECCTLKHYMNRQRSILHGEESRTLRFLPKIIYIICQRLLKLADVGFDLSQSAITTHFNFMLNSSFRNNSTDSESSNGAPRTRELSEQVQNSGRRYSDYIDKKETIRNTTDSQKQHTLPKSSSTPNILEASHNARHDTRDTQLTNGKIVLEPIIQPKRSKKKKRSLQERVKELQNPMSGNNINLSASLPPTKREVDGDFDSGYSSNSFKERMHHSKNKPDSVSLASFSSASNEGLSQNDLVLKHLAFRSSSDIVISTHIERYKRKLNSEDTTWVSLSQETNLAVLSGLFWSWLCQLDSPIVSDEMMKVLQDNMATPGEASQNVDRDIWKLMNFLLTFLSKFDDREEYLQRILRRFSIVMTNEDLPREAMTSRFDEMNQGNNQCVIFFRFISNWLKILKDD